MFGTSRHRSLNILTECEPLHPNSDTSQHQIDSTIKTEQYFIDSCQKEEKRPLPAIDMALAAEIAPMRSSLRNPGIITYNNSTSSIQSKTNNHMNHLRDNHQYLKPDEHISHAKETQIAKKVRRVTETASLNVELKISNTLQYLNLSKSNLKRNGILALVFSTSLSSLKYLNLSENPIRNDEIKIIAETSNWKKFQILILCDIQIDDIGAKYLSTNESWSELEQLDISQNPLIGDLGLMHLSSNKMWPQIKIMFLKGCNIGTKGLKYLRRNKILRASLQTERLLDTAGKIGNNEVEGLNISKKSDWNLVENKAAFISHSLETEKNTYKNTNNLIVKAHQDINWLLRGGFPDTLCVNSEHKELFDKFGHYKERIMCDESNMNELKLYIEALIKADVYGHIEHVSGPELTKIKMAGDIKSLEEDNSKRVRAGDESEDSGSLSGGSSDAEEEKKEDPEDENYMYSEEEEEEDEDEDEDVVDEVIDESIDEEDLEEFKKKEAEFIKKWKTENNGHFILKTEHFDLFKDLSKHFLTSNQTTKPKVLLLTGQAGTGKTLFCKYLQRNLLNSWNSSQNNTEDLTDQWFPIYIDFAGLKKFNTDTISEVLKREATLTEEMIQSFQTSNTRDSLLPNLLIMLDGCDAAIQELLKDCLQSELNYEKLNIPKIIGLEKFKSTKIIFTCREEALPVIIQREQLFEFRGDEETSKLSLDLKLFLERKVEPFTNEQITSYVRKCSYNGLIEKFDETKISSSTLNLQASHSLKLSAKWTLAENFEKMIDDFGLRDIARIPFMLKVIVAVLPSIASDSNYKQDLENLKPLSKYQLIENFVVKISLKNVQDTKSKGTNEAELSVVRMNEVLKAFALKVSEDDKNLRATPIANKDDISILEQSDLVVWDKQLSQFRFRYPLIFEFLIARQLEEEVIEIAKVFTSKESPKLEKDFYFNRWPLAKNTCLHMTLAFLCDAVRDGKITTAQLLSIVYLSRERFKAPDRLKEGVIEIEKGDGKASEVQTLCAIAAANAITILNFSGFDFSHHDLSNIRIPNSDLCYGLFEETDFTNANLQGVNFTSALLNDALLTQSNLKDINFGQSPEIAIPNETFLDITYSRDGKYLAANIEKNVVIFESITGHKNKFKEIRRIPGNFKSSNYYPFSLDNKLFLTSTDKQIQLWNVESGSLLKKLDLKFRGEFQIKTDADIKYIILVFREEIKIKKYTFETNKWTDLVGEGKFYYVLYSLSPTEPGLILISDNDTLALRDLKTGKMLSKLKLSQSQPPFYCGFSVDGKQKFSVSDRERINILDNIRGHMIKALMYIEKDRYNKCVHTSPSYTRQIRLGRSLMLYGAY